MHFRWRNTPMQVDETVLQRSPGRAALAPLRLVVGVLLAWNCGVRAEPPERSTPGQRAQLEGRSTALNNQALRLAEQGRPVAAAPLLKQALAIDRRLYPKEDYPDGHLLLASTLFNLGSV